MSKEAMKLALEALEAMQSYAAAERKGLRICDEAITALREELAEQPAQQEFVCSTGLCHYKAQQQEPVAWISESENLLSWDKFYDHMTPLYTSPPAQRKPLTDDEIQECWYKTQGDAELFARAIEAKLKEKNT